VKTLVPILVHYYATCDCLYKLRRGGLSLVFDCS